MLRNIIFYCAVFAVHEKIIDATLSVKDSYQQRANNHSGRIMGGTPVDIKKMPWQVALHDSGKFFCGGSILSKYHVLTTASCIEGREVRDLTVHSGSSRSTGGDISQVSRVTIHPKYDENLQTFDAAIIKLQKPFFFTTSAIPAILRGSDKSIIILNQTATVAGWGPTHQDDPTTSGILQQSEVTIMQLANCQSAYGQLRVIAEHMTCTMADATRGFCNEDSGGALSVAVSSNSYHQVGIASYRDIGDGCVSEKFPSVYVNIGSPVISDFIDYITNKEAQWA